MCRHRRVQKNLKRLPRVRSTQLWDQTRLQARQSGIRTTSMTLRKVALSWQRFRVLDQLSIGWNLQITKEEMDKQWKLRRNPYLHTICMANRK